MFRFGDLITGGHDLVQPRATGSGSTGRPAWLGNPSGWGLLLVRASRNTTTGTPMNPTTIQTKQPRGRGDAG